MREGRSGGRQGPRTFHPGPKAAVAGPWASSRAGGGGTVGPLLGAHARSAFQGRRLGEAFATWSA